MRFATFVAADGVCHLGVVIEPAGLLDLTAASPAEPAFASMIALIEGGPRALALADRLVRDRRGAMARHVSALDQVSLRAPIPRPRKNVFCVGLNFRSHVELNARALGIRPEVGTVPVFFSKPPTAVIGVGEPIRLDPRLTHKLDYEVELGVVIGTGGTWIAEEDALEHVFGFTLVNDVSARNLQWRTSQMFYGKGLDTYCPMGPWIVDRAEAGDGSGIELVCAVNGDERQRESTDHLIFSVSQIIAELSKGLTLEPGDVIATGTPGGCGYQLDPPRFLADGDVVECSAEGIGHLRNLIVEVDPAMSEQRVQRCG
jgi:2-keto-4-pentenoate hydratase/2-oxohepta-3-ene-1,7-dioic acid hydratase in catechol pathway